jgi:hypothetical protein
VAKQYDTVQTAVEDLRRGDALAMTSDADPRAQVFYVAKVDDIRPMARGDEPRVILTSEPVGDEGEPMVLQYPRGTLMRKIIGIKSKGS